MTSNCPRLLSVCLLALLGSSVSIFAQAIAPTSNAPQTEKGDAVVILSPFEVTAASEDGTYAASATLAAPDSTRR